MTYENHQQGSNKNGVYSIRLKAGKRRTYFFDVRTTKANDYFLTITESKRRFDDNGYERHKIFLYKEDFNKFIDALKEATDHVKTELLPDYDFDQFSHDDSYQESAYTEESDSQVAETEETAEKTTEINPDSEEVTTTEVENNEPPSIDEKVEKW